MPLNDWTDERGWDGVHLLWLAQMLDWIQPRLPEGYRAYVGAVPALTVDASNGRPDLNVRQWTPTAGNATAANSVAAPDQEGVATFELDPQRAIHIDLHGQLIAAIELVSPRNKDRPGARDRYLGRYVGYLRQGVHLLLIDVLPRPSGFSFADAIAADLGLANDPPMPPPCAVSYRVDGPLPEGTLMATWRRPMQVGQPLAVIPLALNIGQAIDIDLEQTYQQAARRAYLT
jgi:Protein of unknown function (DUF4058)